MGIAGWSKCYYTVVKHGYYQFTDFCCKKRGQVFIQVIGILGTFFWNLSILSTSPKLHGLIQHRSMTLHVCPHRLRRCTKQGNVLRRLWDDGGFDESLDESRGSERLGTLGDHPRRDLDGGLGDFQGRNMAIVRNVTVPRAWIFSSLRGLSDRGRIGSGSSHRVQREVDKSGIGLGFQNVAQLFPNHFSNLHTSKLLSPVVWKLLKTGSKAVKAEATMYPTHLHTLRDFYAFFGIQVHHIMFDCLMQAHVILHDEHTCIHADMHNMLCDILRDPHGIQYNIKRYIHIW